ncbi:MAG: Crp/Fnr family transcriptional regulator [Thermodesulfobacteriota bacterium]
MQTMEKLRKVDFFQGLSEEQFAMLAREGRVKRYEPGEIIVSQEEPVRAFYLVLSGQVKIYRSSVEGKEQTLYLFGTGEPFCLCAVFEKQGFPANASALEPSEILVLPGQTFENLVHEAPKLVLHIILVLSRRLKESMRLVENLALKELPQRVATFLVRVAPRETHSETLDMYLPLTHRELAKMLGATPEGLSRVFKRLQNQGLLAVNGRDVRVYDWQTLERLSQGLE